MDMKTITNIFIAGSLALAAMLFAACKQEESPVAKAVLASEQYIEFEAEGASPVAVTVFSDGNWVADYPSWITLSQTSGCRLSQCMFSPVGSPGCSRPPGFP